MNCIRLVNFNYLPTYSTKASGSQWIIFFHPLKVREVSAGLSEAL